MNCRGPEPAACVCRWHIHCTAELCNLYHLRYPIGQPVCIIAGAMHFRSAMWASAVPCISACDTSCLPVLSTACPLLLQMLGDRGPEVAALAKQLATSGMARGDSLPHAHAYEDADGQFQLYEALEDVHGEQDVQRYLQMEFDPVLEVRAAAAGPRCDTVPVSAVQEGYM